MNEMVHVSLGVDEIARTRKPHLSDQMHELRAIARLTEIRCRRFPNGLGSIVVFLDPNIEL